MPNALTVGSVFSGIGGLDLGLERAGMSVIWQSEIDPYCCKVLAKHWPDVPNLGDVTLIDWSRVERPDVICGGYPCQPFSFAGARRGDEDARHLWPYMVGAIRALRPRFAIMENVPGHLALGFGRVLGDLAESGYNTEWDCIPAAAVGARHRRDRVFVVAYPDSESEPERPVDAFARPGQLVPDAEGVAVRSRLRPREQRWVGWGRLGDGSGKRYAWSTEPDVGRVADGVPYRVDRLRGLGNAVVPQVAEFIGAQLLAVLGATDAPH